MGGEGREGVVGTEGRVTLSQVGDQLMDVFELRLKVQQDLNMRKIS